MSAVQVKKKQKKELVPFSGIFSMDQDDECYDEVLIDPNTHCCDDLKCFKKWLGAVQREGRTRQDVDIYQEDVYDLEALADIIDHSSCYEVRGDNAKQSRFLYKLWIASDYRKVCMVFWAWYHRTPVTRLRKARQLLSEENKYKKSVYDYENHVRKYNYLYDYLDTFMCKDYEDVYECFTMLAHRFAEFNRVRMYRGSLNFVLYQLSEIEKSDVASYTRKEHQMLNVKFKQLYMYRGDSLYSRYLYGRGRHSRLAFTWDEVPRTLLREPLEFPTECALAKVCVDPVWGSYYDDPNDPVTTRSSTVALGKLAWIAVRQLLGKQDLYLPSTACVMPQSHSPELLFGMLHGVEKSALAARNVRRFYKKLLEYNVYFAENLDTSSCSLCGAYAYENKNKWRTETASEFSWLGSAVRDLVVPQPDMHHALHLGGSFAQERWLEHKCALEMSALRQYEVESYGLKRVVHAAHTFADVGVCPSYLPAETDANMRIKFLTNAAAVLHAFGNVPVNEAHQHTWLIPLPLGEPSCERRAATLIKQYLFALAEATANKAASELLETHEKKHTLYHVFFNVRFAPVGEHGTRYVQRHFVHAVRHLASVFLAKAKLGARDALCINATLSQTPVVHCASSFAPARYDYMLRNFLESPKRKRAYTNLKHLAELLQSVHAADEIRVHVDERVHDAEAQIDDTLCGMSAAVQQSKSRGVVHVVCTSRAADYHKLINAAEKFPLHAEDHEIMLDMQVDTADALEDVENGAIRKLRSKWMEECCVYRMLGYDDYSLQRARQRGYTEEAEKIEEWRKEDLKHNPVMTLKEFTKHIDQRYFSHIDREKDKSSALHKESVAMREKWREGMRIIRSRILQTDHVVDKIEAWNTHMYAFYNDLFFDCSDEHKPHMYVSSCATNGTLPYGIGEYEFERFVNHSVECIHHSLHLINSEHKGVHFDPKVKISYAALNASTRCFAAALLSYKEKQEYADFTYEKEVYFEDELGFIRTEENASKEFKSLLSSTHLSEAQVKQCVEQCHRVIRERHFMYDLATRTVRDMIREAVEQQQ